MWKEVIVCLNSGGSYEKEMVGACLSIVNIDWLW